MKLEIIFTDEATEILLLIAGQIEDKWSRKQADEFLKKVYRTLDLMSSYPYMYKSSLIKNNIRKGLITKQCAMYYEVQETQITILFFWDNRQEPIWPY